MLLERTDGKRIFYFKDFKELKQFLMEKIRFPREMTDWTDKHHEILIDTEERYSCLQTFTGYSAHIADPDNPYYDAVTAKEKAINILWDAEAVTTHAVNYLLSKGFLPDIYADDAFSRHNTTEQTRADIDFLMRYWRRENY